MAPISGLATPAPGDGTVAVALDGAIVNRDELWRELGAAGGDEELVARLYERHGEAFAARLRGRFAVVVRAPGRLVLARDRFGLVPLAYRPAGSGVEYASDLRALRGEVDPVAADAFLAAGRITPPRTILRGVRAVPPGYVLVLAGGEPRAAPFARAPAERTGETAELVEELRSRLRDSVRVHLAGAKSVGVLLTGGLEPALLAALAHDESGGRVRTFAAGVPRDLRQVAPAFAQALAEPVADPAALAAFAAAREAAGEVAVALSVHAVPAVGLPVELRFPFLDPVVTNLLDALPAGRRARLLRKAAAPLVPLATRYARAPRPAGDARLLRQLVLASWPEGSST
jgi:asparagine synthetase B (glutamine-hydrolysing)